MINFVSMRRFEITLVFLPSFFQMLSHMILYYSRTHNSKHINIRKIIYQI
jgi:hypothetical protein